MKKKYKPIHIHEVKYGNTALIINPPISIQPEYSEDPAVFPLEPLLIADEPELDMHLWGGSINDIRKAAEDEIVFLWQEYVERTDEKLSKSAKELRETLLKRITRKQP
jgi:hypothetical protein